jgi:hypothetical protein
MEKGREMREDENRRREKREERERGTEIVWDWSDTV